MKGKDWQNTTTTYLRSISNEFPNIVSLTSKKQRDYDIIIPWRKNYLLNRISTSPQFSERVTQHKTDRMIWSNTRHGDNEEHIRISENDEWNEGRKNDLCYHHKRTKHTGRMSHKQSAARTMAKDLIAGCFGGVGIVAVGHPFDTLKVHIL